MVSRLDLYPEVQFDWPFAKGSARCTRGPHLARRSEVPFVIEGPFSAMAGVPENSPLEKD